MPSFCRLILDVGNFLNYVSKDSPKDDILLTQKHAALMQSEELELLIMFVHRDVTQETLRALRSAPC
jgi:hypothetical protein